MARDHPELVEQGLALKKAGNEVMTVVGGREIHPVNVRVGGFYRAPTPRELGALVDPLERAREIALETVRVTAGLEFPELELDHELVALRQDGEYAIERGRIVSSAGRDFSPREFDDHIEEEHVERSNALHAQLPRRHDVPRRPARALQPELRRPHAAGARGRGRRRARSRRRGTRSGASSSAASSWCTPATRRCG